MTPGDAYLFRHAIMRDTAYGLQLPSERAELHLHSIDSIEQLFGEQLMPFAEELLEHTRLAALAHHEVDAAGQDSELQRLEFRFLEMAIEQTGTGYQTDAELRYLKEAATHPLATTAARVEYATRAAGISQSRGDLRGAIELSREAVKIAGEAGREQEALEAQIKLNLYLQRAGRRDEIQTDDDEIVRRLHAVGTPGARMSAWELEAEQLESRGEYGKANSIWLQLVEAARESGEPRRQIKALGSLAGNMHSLNRDDHGVSYAREALRIAEETDNRRGISSILNLLGIIFIETSRQKLAEEHYLRAREVAQSIGAIVQAATISGNLGNLQYYFLGGLSKAESAYKAAMELFSEVGDVQRQVEACEKLGMVYRTLGDSERAALYFQRMFDRAERIGSQRFLGRARFELANCYRPGDAPGARYGKFVEALRQAVGVHSGKETVRQWFEFARFLEKQGLVVAATSITSALIEKCLDEKIGFVELILRGGRAMASLLDQRPDDARQDIDWADARMNREHVPHHHVAAVQRPRLVLSVFRQAGPFGLITESTDTEEPARLLATLLETTAINEFRAYKHVAAAVALGQDAASELKQAVDQHRPAMLFCGHPPGHLSPPLRRALMTRLEQRDPEGYNALQRENPELFERMAEGAVDPWLPWDTPAAELPGLGELFQALKKGDSAV